MLNGDIRDSVVQLTKSLLSVKPLLEGIGKQVQVVPVACYSNDSPARWSLRQWSALGELLNRVARRAGVIGLTLSATRTRDQLHIFERVVSDRLALGDFGRIASMVSANTLREVEEAAAAAVADGFSGLCHKETVSSQDGTSLNVYDVGSGDDTVVIIPACGMPAALAEPWIRFLARNRRVLTWESRGLFGPRDYAEDYSVNISAQSADLLAILDHYAVPKAHVLGLCGGAVIALASAAARPESISSLSLWHGAYFFGNDSPTTKHQHSIVELMAIAARSRSSAQAIHAAYCQVALKTTPPDVAHFVLYPYSNPELFYRYCRLNTAIVETHVEQYFDRVNQPTLVVTSQTDETAHPEGSRRVAVGLPNASLRVEAAGDHISLFKADAALLRIADDFISRHAPGSRGH
jgi:pimeloyl-ACP methyl ester carboxylesterase